MRLIDADALKESIRKALCIRSFKYLLPSERIMINKIDNAQTVGDWISVKDRLPEETEDVLIYGYWIGVSGQTYHETWLVNMEEFIYQGNVPIAWMPLPEPPKEETGGHNFV